MKLTDAKIKNVGAKDKRYELYDGDGLILEIMPTGKKYWRYRFSGNGKRYRKTLGRYPIVGLREARAERDKLYFEIKKNGYTESIEISHTFRQVAEEWHSVHKKTMKNERDAIRLWNRLELHVLPFIGENKINAIKPPEILSILRRLADADKLEMASRVRSLCSRIFRYAVATARADNDPTHLLKGAIPSPRLKHFAAITKPNEVGAFLRAIDSYPQPLVRYALQFSALTFCRPSEIQKARWVEFDIKNCEWRIPEERMKEKRLLIVPLARQTLELLEQIRNMSGHCEFLFPSARDPKRRPISESTVLAAIRSLGYTKDQMTAHGFRHMASTRLNESLLWSGDIIEKQLSHEDKNKVRGTYNAAEYLAERRKMMQWWADYLDGLRGQ